MFACLRNDSWQGRANRFARYELIARDKRIRLFLCADRCAQAVAWEHDGLIRQHVELFPDSGSQLIEIAIRKIGSPNAAGKEDVAGEDEGWDCVAADENHVAGRVAGNLANFQIEAGVADDVSFAHKPIGCGCDQRKSELSRQIFFGIGEFVGFIHADHDGAIRPKFFDGGNSADVIAVAVRDQHANRLQPVLCERGHNLAGLETGVDQQALLRAIEPRQVGVLTEGPRDDGRKLKTWFGHMGGRFVRQAGRTELPVAGFYVS